MRKDAGALRAILDDAEKMPGVDAPRLAEVRAEIAAGSALSRSQQPAVRSCGRDGTGGAWEQPGRSFGWPARLHGGGSATPGPAPGGGRSPGSTSSPTICGMPDASCRVASTKSQWMAAGVSPSAALASA